MSAPTPSPPSQQAPARTSRTRIILMLVLGGPALAVGGCALFLTTMNFNRSSVEAIPGLGAIGFIAGILAFIVGLVWALIRFINRRFDKAA